MKTVTAKQAHSQLGAVLDDSQHEPVVILKNGRPYSVVLSAREYGRIQTTEPREARVEKLLASVGNLQGQAGHGGAAPENAPGNAPESAPENAPENAPGNPGPGAGGR